MSAKMKKAIINGEIVNGMTPEMVAWSMGWPSDYGTKEQLAKMRHWNYYAPPPYAVDIYFKNGRLVRQEWPNPP